MLAARLASPGERWLVSMCSFTPGAKTWSGTGFKVSPITALGGKLLVYGIASRSPLPSTGRKRR